MKQMIACNDILYCILQSRISIDPSEAEFEFERPKIVAIVGENDRYVPEQTYKQSIRLLKAIVDYNLEFDEDIKGYFPICSDKLTVYANTLKIDGTDKIKNIRIWSEVEAIYLYILMKFRNHFVKKGMSLYSIMLKRRDFFDITDRNDPNEEFKQKWIEFVNLELDNLFKYVSSSQNDDVKYFNMEKWAIASLRIGVSEEERKMYEKQIGKSVTRMNNLFSDYRSSRGNDSEMFKFELAMLRKMSERYANFGLFEYFESLKRIEEAVDMINHWENYKQALIALQAESGSKKKSIKEMKEVVKITIEEHWQ